MTIDRQDYRFYHSVLSACDPARNTSPNFPAHGNTLNGLKIMLIGNEHQIKQLYLPLNLPKIVVALLYTWLNPSGPKYLSNL